MKVLSLNIEYGGYFLYKRSNESYAYINKYVDLIKQHDIDIVCFQEAFLVGKGVKRPFDITRSIASKLGYYHVNNPHAYISIISKYPLTRLSTNTYNFLTCSIDLEHGKTVLVTNLHLNDEPNTFYSLVGLPYHNTPMVVSEKEAIGLSFAAKQKDLTELFSLLKHRRDPSIICGDFNEVSHLDYPLNWKSSRLLYSKGYADVVRVFHPDPHKDPLFTCDVYKHGVDSVPMRIDMVYYKNLLPIGVDYIHGIKYRKQDMSDHIPILSEFRLSS